MMLRVQGFVSFTHRLGWFALTIIAVDLLFAIFALHITPYSPAAQDLLSANQGLSAAHWLGTDHLGRDTLSRLIAGAQTTLIAVAVVVVIAMTSGGGGDCYDYWCIDWDHLGLCGWLGG